MTALELLLDSYDRVVPLFLAPELAQRWSAPSVLSDWSNRGLAGHLARSAFNLERALDAQPQAETDLRNAVSYYAATAPDPADSATGRRIRELGELPADAGPVKLAEAFTNCVAALRCRQQATGTVVLFGRTLSIEDCATSCLLELVVHADDLAVSLDLPTPTFEPEALDLVVNTLAQISRHRHGALALIRALARAERAPAEGISAF